MNPAGGSARDRGRWKMADNFNGRFQVDTDDLAQRVTMVSNLPTSE